MDGLSKFFGLNKKEIKNNRDHYLSKIRQITKNE